MSLLKRHLYLYAGDAAVDDDQLALFRDQTLKKVNVSAEYATERGALLAVLEHGRVGDGLLVEGYRVNRVTRRGPRGGEQLRWRAESVAGDDSFEAGTQTAVLAWIADRR